jgi:dihydrofolate synthase/folylpolyglutamate synthase
MDWSQSIDNILYDYIGYEHFNPDLTAIHDALKEWDLLDVNSKIITIAGTNGKGETTRALGHLLKNDYKYAQWTSPHVDCVSERFVFNGEPIPAKNLYVLIEFYINKHQELEKPLSYYEFLFAVFLHLVKTNSVDYVLLEVGLGGRLDAVNVLNANLVLLTSISRDHQQFLGERYEEILHEKLGVTRTGNTLVSALELKYLRQLVEQYTDKYSIQWIDLFVQGMDKDTNYSIRNQLLAAKGYTIITGKTLDYDSWEGYTPSNQKLLEHNGVQYYTFGSHNPDGFRKLVQFLSQQNYNNFDMLILAFSRRSMEDIQCMLKTIQELNIPSIKIAGFNHPKAMDTRILKIQAQTFKKVEFIDDLPELLQNLQGSQKILVCGSYYFLGEFNSILEDLRQ